MQIIPVQRKVNILSPRGVCAGVGKFIPSPRQAVEMDRTPPASSLLGLTGNEAIIE
jgi:hypothetical protein